jgi:hypothetical protein
MSGEFMLSPDMAPGGYTLQVSVTGKPAQHSAATQSIDFEIVPASGQ